MEQRRKKTADTNSARSLIGVNNPFSRGAADLHRRFP
jgi:hypothetical protein